MSARVKLLITVILLIACGSGVAWHKVANLGVPFFEGETKEEWLVEARVSFVATGKPVIARLALPTAAVEEKAMQEAGSLNYGYSVENAESKYTAVWSSQERDGNQALYFRIRLPATSSSGAEPRPSSGKPTPVTPLSLPGSAGEAARNIVTRALGDSGDTDILVVGLMRDLRAAKLSQEAVLVKRHYDKEFGSTAPMTMIIDLLGMANVPARIAYGVPLDANIPSQPPLELLEYYDGAEWKIRNPASPSVLPDRRNISVWHRGGGPLLVVDGGESSRVTFTTTRDRIPLERLTDLRDSPLLVSTLLGLPASERSVFRYIVLIPLGAFIVVLMRNIVGIPTLGTFMPVLLALALLELPIWSGLVAFTILIAAGLYCRFLMSRLDLLVVPRVAACVVIVTLLMMLMSIISYRLNLGNAVKITLFPMIILAWTIERMSLIWEEEGKMSAIIQVSGSVFVAVIAYSFMQVAQIRYWAYYFPELLLVLLAGILLLGRYTGYRFSELFRFRSFAN